MATIKLRLPLAGGGMTEISLDDCWEQVTQGKTEVGDKLWSPDHQTFVRIGSDLYLKDYLCVIRRTSSPFKQLDSIPPSVVISRIERFYDESSPEVQSHLRAVMGV